MIASASGTKRRSGLLPQRWKLSKWLAYEDKAKLIVELTTEDSSYRTEHERAREKKPLFSEVDSEVGLQLTPRERFRTSTFLPILDSLLTELVWRTEVAFLFTLLTSSEAELRESACKAHFSIEIEEEVFEDEIIQLVDYIKQDATEAVSSPHSRRQNTVSISKRRQCLQSLLDISRR